MIGGDGGGAFAPPSRSLSLIGGEERGAFAVRTGAGPFKDGIAAAHHPPAHDHLDVNPA
ncbi:hypothetical protein ACWCSD_06335 [Nonomuraea sp. NPDC001684]